MDLLLSCVCCVLHTTFFDKSTPVIGNGVVGQVNVADEIEIFVFSRLHLSDFFDCVKFQHHHIAKFSLKVSAKAASPMSVTSSSALCSDSAFLAFNVS